MHLKNWGNIQLLIMHCGQYERLFKDNTLLQPDEYIFLYTNNDSIVQRNKTRGKELSKSWIDTSFTDYQNEFYETVSKKIPNSRRISTDGKDKMYVSRIIAQILNVQELTDRNLYKALIKMYKYNKM